MGFPFDYRGEIEVANDDYEGFKSKFISLMKQKLEEKKIKANFCSESNRFLIDKDYIEVGCNQDKILISYYIHSISSSVILPFFVILMVWILGFFISVFILKKPIFPLQTLKVVGIFLTGCFFFNGFVYLLRILIYFNSINEVIKKVDTNSLSNSRKSQISQEKRCFSCNEIILQDNKFCQNCGQNIEEYKKYADKTKILAIITEKGLFVNDALKVDNIIIEEWLSPEVPGTKIEKIEVKNEQGHIALGKVQGQKNIGTDKVLVPAKILRILQADENQKLAITPHFL